MGSGADNLIDMQGRASRPGAQKETYKRDTLKGYNDMHSIKGHLCAETSIRFLPLCEFYSILRKFRGLRHHQKLYRAFQITAQLHEI